MDRTAELLEIAQEWKSIASKTLIPAVREACLYQRSQSLEELRKHREALHDSRFKYMV